MVKQEDFYKLSQDRNVWGDNAGIYKSWRFDYEWRVNTGKGDEDGHDLSCPLFRCIMDRHDSWNGIVNVEPVIFQIKRVDCVPMGLDGYYFTW